MRSNTSTAVRNLERSSGDSRVDFDIVREGADGRHCEVHYHTNRSGEGLWEGYDYMRQVIGTCDFRLQQETRSGMYKAIRRQFR